MYKFEKVVNKIFKHRFFINFIINSFNEIDFSKNLFSNYQANFDSFDSNDKIFQQRKKHEICMFYSKGEFIESNLKFKRRKKWKRKTLNDMKKK